MNKKFTYSTVILGLVIIPAVLFGSETDAGDPVLRNMNKYLIAAQQNQKDGLAVIGNIAEMVKRINFKAQQCTVTLGDLKRDEKGDEPTGSRTRASSLGFEYPMQPGCSPESMMIPGSTRSCDHFPENVYRASANSGKNLACLKNIQAYLRDMNQKVTEYCLKNKFSQTESSALQNHLLVQQAKANDIKRRFDQIISDITRFIGDYGACKERLKGLVTTPGTGMMMR